VGCSSEISTPSTSDSIVTAPVTALAESDSPTSAEVAAANDAWQRTSALFTGLFTRQPFVSDRSIYAIASLSELKPSNPPPSESAGVLMAWEDGAWTPLQQFDTECPEHSSCEIAVIANGVVTRPAIAITWCCPADAGAPITIPVGIVLHIVDGVLVDFLTPSATSPDFSVHFVSVESETEFMILKCLESSEYETYEYGLEGICNHLVETAYRFTPDAPPVIETVEIFTKTPITDCLEFVIDDGCQRAVQITPSDECPNPVRNDSQFPLRQCQYGIWILYFELSVSELGYGLVADGYYDASEITIIKQLQRDFKLNPDGLIGPRTWGAAQPFSVCTPQARALSETGSCTEDSNNDGVYGPGDIVPH
jgi:hypothetical protein